MKYPQKSKRFSKNINANTTTKDEHSKSIEKRNTKNKTKYEMNIIYSDKHYEKPLLQYRGFS